MISKEQIARINALYKKQQSEGLSEEEKKEQAYLRRLYIDAVKANLKAQLDSIKIVKTSTCCEHHNHNHHNHNHMHKGCSHSNTHRDCDCHNH
ncbi:DUF896 domain-containing protein [Tepidanaerobacter sp. GT38]|uniref:DUF896 domain-containing protein n=1 Tax=Tepidanaerobacter sp. GT38 TaxID=2722793 RepID=UPI001F1BAEA1|nr:DUF896 domain-containing protein [Tepidanaerobacter sp. GT38]MCG1011929.1 DUF896 domain-containing protein [Tepidanaerobacter sp. GT38]